MSFLSDLFYPKKCLGCKKIGNYICINCLTNLPQANLICPYCEKPSIGGATHPLCITNWGLEGLWSLGSYQAALKQAIYKLKYKFVYVLSDELTDIIISYFAKHPPLFLDKIKQSVGKDWVVTSVPLYKTRQNWRGYNQSEILAKNIALKIGLNYKNLLKKTKQTKTQVSLSGRDRSQNVKNVFEKIGEEVTGLNILLFDDVWTTGSTAKECCKVLKRSGAKTVWAITLAR